MSDVYHRLGELDSAAAEQLVAAMELRARDEYQRAILADYVGRLGLRKQARVLEVGSGSGAISRALAARDEVAEVVGVEPMSLFVSRARELAAGVANVSFVEADGRDIPLPDMSFDAVVIHTVLSHALDPDKVLLEAFRVLRPGAPVAIFDGDYNTISVATGDVDPLQACAEAFVGSFVNDAWLVRRLPALLTAAGFLGVRVHSYGYVQVTEPNYLLTIVDRGADTLVAQGRVGESLATALKAEARWRVSSGTFFGHIAYASVLGRRPD